MLELPQFDERAFAYYPRLAQLRDYVNLHYSERIDLETAAAVAGLEKTYFSRYFHDKTGVCYQHWLRLLRVKRAIGLMQSSDIPITKLAFDVGFNDLRTFERAFQRYAGTTPREMKRFLQPGRRSRGRQP